MTTKDLEKEIELAEDLKGKLDQIEGKKTSKRSKKTVSQEVKSPTDADKTANVGELDLMKQKLVQLEEIKEENNYPDPVKHKHISFIKSGFRILAGATLFFGEFAIAGVLFIVAELLGVYEEIV